MITSYGPAYGFCHKGTRHVKELYGVRRAKYGWIVYQTCSGEIAMVLPTKLRAYYVATKFSGIDTSVVFYFGGAIFG